MCEKQPKFNKRKIKKYIYTYKVGFKFRRHDKCRSVPGSVLRWGTEKWRLFLIL